MTVLENGRKATIQTVTTPMASLVFYIPSYWSVLDLLCVFCSVTAMYSIFSIMTPYLVHIFALVFQRPINTSNAVTVAHQVRTYTLEAAGFTDSVDVLYVAQMMEKFMEYVRPLREVRKIYTCMCGQCTTILNSCHKYIL